MLSAMGRPAPPPHVAYLDERTPSPRRPTNLVLPMDGAYEVETKVSPGIGSRITMPSAEFFGEEAMAAFKAEMKQQHKREVHKKVIHKRPQMTEVIQSPTIAMGMVPMSMGYGMAVQDNVEEFDEVIVQENSERMFESLKQVWDAKIAQRDAQWQAVIHEMQARMSVMSMHTHSQDSSLQCEIARLKHQVTCLEQTIVVQELEKGDLLKCKLELTAVRDGLLLREGELKRLLQEMKMEYERLTMEYERVQKELALALSAKVKLIEQFTEKDTSMELSLDVETEGIRTKNVEFIAEISMLKADLQGSMVHIERLQGIISLLQVKLAERDDLKVQAAFSQEIVFSEQKEARVVEVRDLEIETRIETQVKERVTREIHVKEQEIIELRAKLEKVTHIEETHHYQLRLMREEHMRELEKVKMSYKYLDDVIRVDPGSYDFKHYMRYTQTVTQTQATGLHTLDAIKAEAAKIKFDLNHTKDVLSASKAAVTLVVGQSHDLAGRECGSTGASFQLTDLGRGDAKLRIEKAVSGNEAGVCGASTEVRYKVTAMSAGTAMVRKSTKHWHSGLEEHEDISIRVLPADNTRETF